MKTLYSSLCIVMMTIVFSHTAHANSGGVIGRSQSGCGTCHGGSQSPNTSVNVLPLGTTSISMTPGQTRNFQISVAHASAPTSGVNISIVNAGGSNVGTFTAGTGLRLASGELTHSSPQPIGGTPRQTIYSFSWTAPTAAGTYTLRAAGNAVNGNSSDDAGDNWRVMNPITINVSGLSLDAPNGGEVWCRNGTGIIKWTAAGIAQVALDYNPGDGSWNPITVVNASLGQFTWNLPGTLQPGGNYSVRIRAVGGTEVDQSNAPFSVGAAPTIVTDLKPRDSVCFGAERTFRITTDNNTLYTYQWRKNGQDIPGANAATYGIQNVDPSHNGTYSVKITGCGQNVFSADMLFFGLEAPQITQSPATTSACEGKSATLSVEATGWKLAYRWRRNGKDVAGGNKATLVIANVNSNTVGEYDCEVRGGCGTRINSEKATLFAKGAPKFNENPKDTLLCAGTQHSLELPITDEEGLTFAWKLQGKALPAITSKSITWTNLSVADTGEYEVTVTNSCALKTTAKFKVRLLPVLSITKQPEAKTVNVGEALVLSVETNANAQYQWWKDDQPITGATSNPLIINKVKKSDQGTYKCVVTGNCNEVNSLAANIVVNGSVGAVLAFQDKDFRFNCTSLGKSRTFSLPNWIINSGDVDLLVPAMTLSGDTEDFTIASPTAPLTVAPKESKSLTFTFAPKSLGQKKLVITFSGNTNGNDSVMTLTMQSCETSVEPGEMIILKPIPNNQTSDSVVKICNTGTKEFEVSNVDIFETQTGISITNQDNIPRVMKVSDCHNITIRFAPKTEGPRTALLNFRAGTETHSIIVMGSTTVSSVEEEIPSQQFMSLYPNPASDNITFSMQSQSGKAEIIISDIVGNIVDKIAMDSVDFTWSTDTIANGQYYALIRMGTSSFTIPFTIIK